MAKLKLAATTTTAVTTEVALKPQARTMLKKRCEEHASLAKAIKDAKGRQERIKGEIEELFQKEGYGAALMDGTELAGHRIKMVCGETSDFDRIGFMKHHGLSQEDFDAFTSKKPKKPYIKVTAPGEKE